MNIQEFFNTYGVDFIVHRFRLNRVPVLSVEEGRPYEEVIRQACSCVPNNNGWELERVGKFLKIKGVEESEGCFKLFDENPLKVEDFAGIDCGNVRPLKFSDVLDLVDELTFFVD